MRATITRIVVAVSLGQPAGPALAQSAPLQNLDDYVERAVADWNVPALSIAVVKDDRVVFARGYGVLDLEGRQGTDEHTIFGVGSTTKAYTAAALGMLVDEGRLDWDDRVIDHLPDFRLHDTYATANITVRDLLSHTSGLSRGDRMWYTRDFDRAEVVRRVRYQEPTWTLREQYGYSNTMFTAAGLVLEAITGQTWDDFVRNRIFEPLGMTRTSTTIVGLDRVPNVARQYTSVAGRPAAIPYWNQDNIGPAGSINSTAADMAQWVRLQLADGSFGGRSLVAPERIHEMHSAQTVVRSARSDEDPPVNFDAYGLGWRLRDYEGRKLVHHGGGGHGVSALVGLVPEEDLGIVVLSNMDGSNLPMALIYHVVDQYIGTTDRDWSRQFLEERDSSLARAARNEQRLADERVRNTAPSLPLEAYTGTYRHPFYGDADAWIEDGQLHFRFVSDIEGPLEHWHFDTFRAHWEHPRYGKNFLTFLLDASGKVDRVRFPPEWDTSYLAEFEKVREDEGLPTGS